MTILAQVYSGHTTDNPLIPCLEISSPAFVQPIRNCAGFEDQTVTLELDHRSSLWIDDWKQLGVDALIALDEVTGDI